MDERMARLLTPPLQGRPWAGPGAGPKPLLARREKSMQQKQPLCRKRREVRVIVLPDYQCTLLLKMTAPEATAI